MVSPRKMRLKDQGILSYPHAATFKAAIYNIHICLQYERMHTVRNEQSIDGHSVLARISVFWFVGTLPEGSTG
jgi:hypothetical protein